MGTVIGAPQLARMHAMVEKRSSGKILAGGAPLTGKSSLDGFDFSRGSFYPPTVIGDVETTDELWREEVFGPVVVTRRFEVCRAPRLVLARQADIARRLRTKVLPLPTTAGMVSVLDFGHATSHGPTDLPRAYKQDSYG